MEIVKTNRANQIIYAEQPKLLGHATKLTAATTDGATSLTVENGADFSDNEFVLIGKFGGESSEITDCTAAGSDHALTVTAIRHNHPVGTPVSFLRYDRIRFKSATSEDGTYTDVAGATGSAVQADREHTAFEDTAMADTTWYEVFGYDTKNTATTSASIAVQSTGFKTGSLRDIIDQSRSFTRQPDENFVTDDEITDMSNSALQSIQSKRAWASMETVDYGAIYTGRSVYSLPSDYQRIRYLKVYDENTLSTWYAGHWVNATSTYTDDTTDAQSSTATDFPLCTTTTNDGFAVVGNQKFCRIVMDIGTAQAGSPVYVYYYWNGSTWSALTSYIVDTPVYTSASVTTDLSFIPPNDWRPLPQTTTWTDEDSTSLSGNYAILMKASTAPTTAPVVDDLAVYYADSYQYCEYQNPSSFRTRRSTNAISSQTEFPSEITIWGSNYEVYPIPQYNRLTELTYYSDFTRFSDMNDVSGLPSYMPILWNVCMMIELKFGEPDRAIEFERKYNEALEDLVRQEEKQKDRLKYVRDDEVDGY